MKITKIPPDHLRPLVEEAVKTGGPDWAEKYLVGIKRLIQVTPLRYRTFGPYWWGLKQALLARGVATFGDGVDREWLEAMSYGDEALDIAAAYTYEDQRMDGGMNIYDENHALEDDGEAFDYVLIDSDVERLALR